MFCPNCGRLNDDNATNCCACNTQLKSNAEAGATTVLNSAPVEPTPAQQEPVYNQPPVYQQPAYQQQQPVYQQPVYQQPVYQQPYAPNPLQKPKANTTLPFIICLIGAIMVIVSIFCPILTVKSSLASYAPDDQENISIVKYTELEMEDDEEEGLVYVGMLAVIAIGAILALAFSLARKGVMVIISAILVAIPFALWVYDISDRNLTTFAYDYGVALYLFIVSIVLLLAGGIWLLIAKSSAKNKQFVNPYAQ